jgi:hypothetical protein
MKYLAIKGVKMKNIIFIFIVLLSSYIYANDFVCGINKSDNNSRGYTIYDNDINGTTYNNKEEMVEDDALLLHLGKCSKDKIEEE